MNSNLFISLGDNCYVSWTIRNSGYQQSSFPLDWVNSFRIKEVAIFLSDLNADFIKELVQSPIKDELENNKIKFSERYNFRLPHEWDKNPQKTISEIKDMYERRILRLVDQGKSANWIYFLRNVSQNGYKNFLPEGGGDYTKNIDSLNNSIKHSLGHERFSIILCSASNFECKTPKNNFILQNIVPFHLGFYGYKDEIQQRLFFDNYTSFIKYLDLANPHNLTSLDLQSTYDKIFSGPPPLVSP
jgi:hypothetical protein